jgi:hypothetical protein
MTQKLTIRIFSVVEFRATIRWVKHKATFAENGLLKSKVNLYLEKRDLG